MDCIYCSTYQNSTVRTGDDLRFCKVTSKMTTHGKFCEDFHVADLFWCDKTGCWISIPICVARQDRKCQECTNCRQKKTIWDIKRFMGRQTDKPKTLIRR
jgi:hypothetical protein